jgi:hypothetical protein
MTPSLISQKNSPGIERLPAGRLAGFCCAAGNCPECLRAYRRGLAFMRQERAARVGQVAPRKPRKPTLASVAKQANKAAIPVARYEVKPDGTVVVMTGKP